MSLIADIFDIILQTDTGDLIASTTLQSADLKIAVDSKEVRGGRGDALLAILHSKRDVDLSVSEITFKWDWIANQLGVTASTGATTAWATSKIYTCVDLDGEAAGTAIGFTLDNTPLASSSGLKIFNATTGVEVALTSGYTISTADVTIVGGVVGAKYEVRGYKYTTGATASSLDINNTSFADGCVCILETLEISEDETPLARIQIQLDECLPSGNFSISTKKEKDANVSNFDFRAIKPANSNSIGRMIRIPIS